MAIELYQLYDEPVASVLVKLRKWQCAGHVERMDDKRRPNRLFQSTLEVRPLVGKPRKRWEDPVEEPSKKLLKFSS